MEDKTRKDMDTIFFSNSASASVSWIDTSEGSVHHFMAMPTSPVIGKWNFAGLDVLDILYEDFIVPFHFLRRFPTHGLGNILPAVRGVLVILCQCLFK